ncbi:MAG: ABC transporter permease, partial [Gemmatimonadaceae bacterium]|nr:ABC transporter permease [Gemmatimonadaceae bacterium]
MWPDLARAALARHPLRTTLAIVGVAVSAALLLDMVMLATGMRDSFAELYLKKGFPLRVAPKGTLPFDTEATIGDAAALRSSLEGGPFVARVSPVLGLTLHHVSADAPATTVLGFGVDPRVQGDYELVTGRDMVASATRAAPIPVVVNAPFLAALGKALGDTLSLVATYDPQLRTTRGRIAVQLVGEARFLYSPPASPVVAMPLAVLQGVHPEGPDRVSLFMADVRDTARVEEARAWLERTAPRVRAFSTATAMVQVEQRL